MGRLRRTSKTIEQAEARATGLKSKEAAFDLGNNLTATTYDQAITAARAKLDAYNQTLATADDQLNDFLTAEKALTDLSGRMLAAVKAKYGADSSEYELAGGIRRSERKRPARKQSTPKP